MTEQERVMEWSYLSSIMLQLKPGALTETAIDRDSSCQYLPASCQIGTWPKCKVSYELSDGLVNSLTKFWPVIGL